MQVKEPGDDSKEITLDAVNGVGALKVQKLLEQTPGLLPPSGSMHGFKFTRFYCSFVMKVKEPGDYSKEITLDAANSVGALKVQKLLEQTPGLEVIKHEFILKLKIKRNDWLLADTCPQTANHWALF